MTDIAVDEDEGKQWAKRRAKEGKRWWLVFPPGTPSLAMNRNRPTRCVPDAAGGCTAIMAYARRIDEMRVVLGAGASLCGMVAVQYHHTGRFDKRGAELLIATGRRRYMHPDDLEG